MPHLPHLPHRLPGLIGRLLLVLLVCNPLGLAAAQTAPCEALARLPQDLRSFQQAALAYAQLASQPQTASDWLLCLKRGNPELADTLMLHKRSLLAPARTALQVEDAFLHYVVNTTDPKLGDGPSADAERLARQYRQTLLLAPGADLEAQADCGAVPWTLARLRCVGQATNHQRYGRGDVVPVRLLDFVPSASGYSTIDATWMSELAALAYWDPGLVGLQLARWGFVQVADISDPATDTSAFLASRDAVLVLAFRGTSSLKDFLTDGDVRRVRVDWAQGSVHSGFKRAADAAWKPIVSALGPPQAQTRDIVLTGHSLGAALAQLTALRLTQAGYRVRSVYTFGTPRVGDADFVADYNRQLGARSFPHVNHQDLVTRVPPSALGYRAAAQANTRVFTGPGHELTAWAPAAADDSRPAGNWMGQVRASIGKATEFLPEALRPQALRSAAPGGPPRMNLYSTTFEKGPVDDHGSFEYLFKLVCASIEYELWPLESRLSAAPPKPGR